MSVPRPAAGLVLLLAAAPLLAGCLSGSPEACRGFVHEEPVLLDTLPDLYTDDEGWALIVHCNADARPLSSYTFHLLTPRGYNITMEPTGNWDSPTTFYAPLSNTTEGDAIGAQDEDDGRGGDPTFRVRFVDDNENGLFDGGDKIDLTYEAGAVSREYRSPLETGIYWLEVIRNEDGELVGRGELLVPG